MLNTWLSNILLPHESNISVHTRRIGPSHGHGLGSPWLVLLSHARAVSSTHIQIISRLWVGKSLPVNACQDKMMIITCMLCCNETRSTLLPNLTKQKQKTNTVFVFVRMPVEYMYSQLPTVCLTSPLVSV